MLTHALSGDAVAVFAFFPANEKSQLTQVQLPDGKDVTYFFLPLPLSTESNCLL